MYERSLRRTSIRHPRCWIRCGSETAPQIERAAEICANSIANGGLVFLFGNGHSRMMCEEMTPRQGCYAGFFALVELALSNHANIVGTNGLRAPLMLEKFEGYAEAILKGFHFGRTTHSS